MTSTGFVIAVVTIPAAGHVNPTLPVVARLLAGGDRVVYFAPEQLRAVVAPTGAEFRALPTPPLPMPQHPADMRAQMLRMAQGTPWLVAELAALRPDVVVHDSLSLLGALAARALDLPTVASTTTFAFGDAVPAPGRGGTVRSRMLDRWLHRRHHGAERAAAEALRPMLADLGLAGSLPDPLALSGDATVVFTSRSLQPAAASFGPTHHFVGPSTGDRQRHDDLSWAQLAAPLLYVSFGTMFTPRRGLLAAAADGLSGLGGSVLVSTGRGAEMGRVPSDVIVRRSMPQLAVLRRAAAMVSHGGMNSVHEALQAGVPLVLVPHGADQPLVARQVADAGAGIVISPARATAAVLRRAVSHLLYDPAYARRARKLGAELAAAGGADRAAAVIRQVAAAHRPALTRGLP